METPFDLALQRVERAQRCFQESLERRSDAVTISRDLDELDTAVELWLDAREAAEAAETA